jgi:hypothetical protein
MERTAFLGQGKQRPLCPSNAAGLLDEGKKEKGKDKNELRDSRKVGTNGTEIKKGLKKDGMKKRKE